MSSKGRIFSHKKGKRPIQKRLFGLTDEEVFSIVLTAIMTGITLVLLALFYYQWKDPVGVTLSAGAFGGFLHEFVQSKGKILFIERKDDGLYLGSISGLILGLVAGILIYGGTTYNIIPSTPSPDQVVGSMSLHGIAEYSPIQQGPSPQSNNNLQMGQLLFEGLIAGLALKGISEAATSRAKIGDSFDVVSVNFEPSVISETNSGVVKVTIKNNMNTMLELQAITMFSIRNESFTSTRQDHYEKEREKWSVPQKSATTIELPGFRRKYEEKYTLEVVSNNGKKNSILILLVPPRKNQSVDKTRFWINSSNPKFVQFLVRTGLERLLFLPQ
jgi:hypothetical protein